MKKKIAGLMGGTILMGGLFGSCAGGLKPCAPTIAGNVVIVPGCELDIGVLVSDALGNLLD